MTTDIGSGEMPLAQTPREIIPPIFSRQDGEVIAEFLLKPGEYGDLATVIEHSPGAANAYTTGPIKSDILYMNFSLLTGDTERLLGYRMFAPMASHLGYGIIEVDGGEQGYRRETSMPTAGYLNSALDDLPAKTNGMRFFEPADNRYDGKISAAAFVEGLAQGVVPLPKPSQTLYAHDIGHALGYILMSNRQVESVRKYAETLVENGIPKKYDSRIDKNITNFGDSVDLMSDSLRPGTDPGEYPVGKRIFIAGRCGYFLLRGHSPGFCPNLTHILVGAPSATLLRHDIKKTLKSATQPTPSS
ncbi:MAG: hypothetical protein ABI354_01795 [Candidatus Saccharimonadales bacterium]